MKAHFPVFNLVNNIGGINFEELSVNISEYFLAIEGDSDNKRCNKEICGNLLERYKVCEFIINIKD